MKKAYILIIISVFGVCFVKGQKPVANFSASSDTICYGNWISFSDLSTNNPAKWHWSFQGGSPDTSNDQNPENIFYESSGSVKLVVSNSSGSDSLEKNNFITVYPYPTISTITQSHDTLFCSTDPSYIFYEWYENDTLISSGINDTSLAVNSSDQYDIAVYNNNCCETSSGYNILITPPAVKSSYIISNKPCNYNVGVENLSSDNIISLYPNPASSQLTIQKSSFNNNEHVNIIITNVLGQTLRQSAITNPQSEIDVSNLSSGIYFVEVVGRSGRWVSRFVKE